MLNMSPISKCLLLLASLGLAHLQLQAAQPAPRVQLEVNFEMRCPDSARFFLDQALPTYTQLQDIIDLKLIPFGKAHTSGNRIFCQHGPRECDLNRLVACVDSRTPASNKLPIVQFVHCIFEGLSNPSACLAKFQPALKYEDMDKCAKGDESFKMMQAFEKETGVISYVPRIAVNGDRSSTVQDKAENSLMSYLCEVYQGTKPEACSKSVEN